MNAEKDEDNNDWMKKPNEKKPEYVKDQWPTEGLFFIWEFRKNYILACVETWD